MFFFLSVTLRWHSVVKNHEVGILEVNFLCQKCQNLSIFFIGPNKLHNPNLVIKQFDTALQYYGLRINSKIRIEFRCRTFSTNIIHNMFPTYASFNVILVKFFAYKYHFKVCMLHLYNYVGQFVTYIVTLELLALNSFIIMSSQCALF